MAKHVLVNNYLEGRAKFKPFKGKYFDRVKDAKAACDVGAMYWGTYHKINVAEAYTVLSQDFPEASNMRLIEIPCEHAEEWEGTGSVLSILIHLNDEHDGRSWPVERKAKWLEDSLPGMA